MIEGIIIGIIFISTFILGFNLGAKTVDKQPIEPIKEVKKTVKEITDIPNSFSESGAEKRMRCTSMSS